VANRKNFDFLQIGGDEGRPLTWGRKLIVEHDVEYDHSYFLQNGEIFCLDYEFAMGKLESGVLWRVMKGLEQGQKEPYLSFWGRV